MTRRTHRLAGLTVVLVFAGLATIYSLTTPVFEAPDEVWHYAYVRYLAEGHGLPSLTDDESGAYQEVAQPPLYYAAAALVSRLAPDEDLEALMWHNPGFGYQAGVTVNDNKNMLIHTEREQFPWQGAVLAIRLGRFVSLAFGLLTVVAAWGLGQEAFPQRPFLALGVAAIVALTPQFLFISGVVSNDSAAAALSTCALWTIVRVANRGATYRRSFAVGLLIGLAALTKTSTLLLIPLAVLALILAHRPLTSSTHPLISIIVHCSLFIVVAFAIGGWWYLRNALRYRDPLALYAHQDTPWGRTVPASIGAMLAQLPTVYHSFWGAFGWGHVQYPAWVYLALGVGPVISLIGWGRAAKQRVFPGSRQAVVLAVAWWTLVFTALLQWMRQVEAPHGRLLFPAIGAGAMLLVGGWAALPRPRLTPIFLTGLAILSLLTPWMVIRPAFAPPCLLSPADVAEIVQGISLTYGDKARLWGVSLDQASTVPGGTLPVRACWEALVPMSEDYTVFVHLVGRDNARVAERHTYPGLGRFPTSRWPVGQAFCDVYRLTVEDWTPVPEMYDVVIGLYDASTNKRLPPHDLSGNKIDFASLARVRVAPEGPLSELNTDVHPLSYKLGEQITLVGYQLSGAVQSGTPLTVTLYWSADEQPGADYTVFVHLLSEEHHLEESALEPLAQHDGPPRYGRYPTSVWQVGDLVPDEHVLEIPTLAAGQHVRLVVGMYRADTLERLSVAGPEGAMPDGLIPLPLTIR